MELNLKKVSKQLDYDKKFEDCGFSTKAIHVGSEPDGVFGGVSVPINLSTTYAQTSPGDPIGPFDYARVCNPTKFSLERCIASIENGKLAIAFSSGMGAIAAIIHMLSTGDEVVSIDDVYGGTQRYFRKVCNPNSGIVFNFVDFQDIEVVKKAITSKTKIVWFEAATNPTLKVTDIELVTKTVKNINKDILVVVDNTFLSPFNCRPLDLGADIVMESGTKYLGGHSDVVMGTIATNNEDLYNKLFFINKNLGACPSPFDSYLVLRGLKTLALRMERINSNALKIAEYLEKSKHVEKVLYPGLKSSPFHKIAKKQFKGFGGLMSFYMKGGLEEAKAFINHCKIFTLAESLGAVESLIEIPALMTHLSVHPDHRAELGITDNMIRIAVGVEDVEDLIKDLTQAFEKISKTESITTSPTQTKQNGTAPSQTKKNGNSNTKPKPKKK